MHARQRGFSLLELLAALSITGMLLIVTSQLTVQALRVADDATVRLGTTDVAVARAHLRNDLQRGRLSNPSTAWRSSASTTMMRGNAVIITRIDGTSVSTVSNTRI